MGWKRIMGRAGFGTGCVRSEGLADCKFGHEIFRREPFLLSHEPTCRYLSVLDQSMAICVNPDRRAVFHSDRKASTGLIEAARLAGTTAAAMAMIKRTDTDAQMETRSALLV